MNKENVFMVSHEFVNNEPKDILFQAISFFIEGKLDETKFKDTLDQIMAENEIFSTTFELRDSELYGEAIFHLQNKTYSSDLKTVDVQSKEEALELMKRNIRDHSWQGEHPFWEFLLFKLSEDQYIFYGKISHGLIDGIGIQVLIGKILRIYNGQEDIKTASYFDFLEERTDEAYVENTKKKILDWNEIESKGYQEFVHFPENYDKAPSYVPFFEVDKEELQKIARRNRTTRFNVFLYLYFLSLAVSYEVNDVEITTVVDGRGKKYANTIGLFVGGSCSRIIFQNEKGIIGTWEENKMKLMKNLKDSNIAMLLPNMGTFLLTYMNNAGSSMMNLKLGDATVIPNDTNELSDEYNGRSVLLYAAELEKTINVTIGADEEIFPTETRRVFINAFNKGIEILKTENDIPFSDFSQIFH